MKIIRPHIFIVDEINGKEIIKKINRSARKCYQSEPIGPDEYLVRNIIKNMHTSVLEHVSITIDIITNRAVLAELTRHRIASYSVESTRYVRYECDDMEFIKPIEFKEDSDALRIWEDACESSAHSYTSMLEMGLPPQSARSVLNNSVKTEIRMTINLRSLRNLFSLRCDKAAHPHMKEIMIPLMLYLRDKIPVIFDDIPYDDEFAKKYNLTEFKNYVSMIN